MSSVTFRKSLAQRRQQQADAAAQGAAGSESGSKAQRTATGAAQLRPLVPLGRGVVGAALLAATTVALHVFSTPWVRGRLAPVGYAVMALLALDFSLCHRYGGGARWYLLHAFANFVVAAAAAEDLWASLLRPTHCYTGAFSLWPAWVVPAIHLYHLLAFECSTADWVHHLLFAGIIGPIGFFFEPGPVQNTVGFFICGLPGGLDYLMLALVKLHRMDRYAEKRINSRINVWLRSPGLLFAAFCCVYGRFDVHAPQAVKERVPWWVAVSCALLCALNGQYYMQVVVGNTFVRSREFGSVYNS